MMMKWILILSFLILGSLADLGHFATVAADKEPPIGDGPVSYTHLTLPTKA